MNSMVIVLAIFGGAVAGGLIAKAFKIDVTELAVAGVLLVAIAGVFVQSIIEAINRHH